MSFNEWIKAEGFLIYALGRTDLQMAKDMYSRPDMLSGKQREWLRAYIASH